MASINKAIIIGRIGKIPEFKTTPNGLKIGNFSVATSENIKRGDNWEEIVEWHNVVLLGKQAEYAEGKIEKGNMVYVEGKIQTRSWEGNDGNKKYKTEIVGFTLKNLSPRSENSGAVASSQVETKPAVEEEEVPF